MKVLPQQTRSMGMQALQFWKGARMAILARPISSQSRAPARLNKRQKQSYKQGGRPGRLGQALRKDERRILVQACRSLHRTTPP